MSSLVVDCPTPNQMLKPALQLWALHEELREDAAAILDWVALQEFSGVELAGFARRHPKKLAAMLQSRNLVVVGLHGPHIGDFATPSQYAKWVVATCELLSTETVSTFRDSHLPEPNLADYEQLAQSLRKVCTFLQKRGLRISYHCFEEDFRTLQHGTRGFELLLREVPNPNFGLQLDTYWIACAQTSTTDLLSATENRVFSIHVNDVLGRTLPRSVSPTMLLDIVRDLGAANPGAHWILEDSVFGPTHTGPKLPIHKAIARSAERWRELCESLNGGK